MTCETLARNMKGLFDTAQGQVNRENSSKIQLRFFKFVFFSERSCSDFTWPFTNTATSLWFLFSSFCYCKQSILSAARWQHDVARACLQSLSFSFILRLSFFFSVPLSPSSSLYILSHSLLFLNLHVNSLDWSYGDALVTFIMLKWWKWQLRAE